MALRLEFQWSATTAEPPTGSQVRIDAADPAQATRMWVRNITTPGEDVHTLLMLAGLGDRLYVQDYDDHTRYAEWTVAGEPVDKGSYVELPLAWVMGGQPLAAQKVSLIIVPLAEVLPPEPTPPLPVPALDPAMVQAYLGCTEEQAEELALLATLALQAAAYPNPLPAPLPAPLVVVGLQVSARLYATEGVAGGGQVVSESLGSYTYRLATAPGRDVALMLTDDELALASPWLKVQAVYELRTGHYLDRSAWPIDWWQRDYDSLYGWPLADGGPPQVAPAAARLLDPSEAEVLR